MSTKPGFYAVRVGRVPGVYITWDACKEQVHGFPCAWFKKFERMEDARVFIHQHPSPPRPRWKCPIQPLLLAITENQNYPGNAHVEQTGSENTEVNRGGVKQVHVEEGVTKKRPLADSESHNQTPAKKNRHDEAIPSSPKCTKFSTLGTSPLIDFFSQYSDFEYNPTESATDEFYRLLDHKGWDKDDEERTVAKQEFQDALTKQFNDSYGTDVEDLAKWQALCEKLGMDPVPDTLNACQKAVRNTHVNLVDLVDIFDTREKARIFPTVFALSKYTKEHGKFFPRHNAHSGNLLKFLLRQILNPSES